MQEDRGKGFDQFSKDGVLYIDSIPQAQRFAEMNTGSPRWFKDAPVFGTRFCNGVVYGGRYFIYSIKDGAKSPNRSFRHYIVAEVTDTGMIHSLITYHGSTAGNPSALYYAKKEAAALGMVRVTELKARKAAMSGN